MSTLSPHIVRTTPQSTDTRTIRRPCFACYSELVLSIFFLFDKTGAHTLHSILLSFCFLQTSKSYSTPLVRLFTHDATMPNQHEDYANVGRAAARAPQWISFYPFEGNYFATSPSQYPDTEGTGVWLAPPSEAPDSATPQTMTLQGAPAASTPSHHGGQISGQGSAFAGTAADTYFSSTPLHQDAPFEADSTFTSNSALPSDSTSTATSFAYDGYGSSRRPVLSRNTISGGRPIYSRGPHTPSARVHPHQPHEAEHEYPPKYYPDPHRLQVPGRTPLAPISPSLTAIPSPTPSSFTTTSTSAQGLFTPQQCQWKNCSSSTVFQREGDLIRHLKTIHISPNAFPCPEPECPRAFGRNDHLKNHMRTMHGS
ncbi:hypothetical protein BJX66DRAFT_314935 [Aspergillus keveii]|uniref:C2H2-type domain-containing protein n=1 Tax=Aspergillus keveii TaxID=714993 RepID=A0ABR4FQC5_9EURO